VKEDAPLNEKITFIDFQKISSSLFLLMGYDNGYAVWDCSDVTEGAKEITSRRVLIPLNHCTSTAVNVMQLLPSVGERAFSLSDKTRETLLILNYRNSNNLFLINLCNGEICHTITFASSIYEFQCKNNLLVVRLSEVIHVYNSSSFEFQYSLPIYPNSCYRNVIDIGALFLAFPSSSHKQKHFEFYNNKHVSKKRQESYSLWDHTFYVATSTFNGISTLGDKAITYMNSSPSKITSPSPTIAGDPISIGRVTLINTETGQEAANFKSHRSSISAIKFSPSGSLLVTADENGQEIFVHDLNHIDFEVPKYRLLRGITHADIRCINFSMDGSLVVISNALRGTCHIFNLETSMDLSVGSNNECNSSSSNSVNDDISQVQMSSTPGSYSDNSLVEKHLAHLKGETSISSLGSVAKTPALFSTVPNVLPFLSSISDEESKPADAAFSQTVVSSIFCEKGLLVCSNLGVLSFYQRKQKLTKGDKKNSTTNFDINHKTSWDVQRNSLNQECAIEHLILKCGSSQSVSYSMKDKGKWIENAVFETCEQWDIPIYQSPQFQFHNVKEKSEDLNPYLSEKLDLNPIEVIRTGPKPIISAVVSKSSLTSSSEGEFFSEESSTYLISEVTEAKTTQIAFERSKKEESKDGVDIELENDFEMNFDL
jgi:hypothetical protein